jgi:predicted metalloprotease with PDZ domain
MRSGDHFEFFQRDIPVMHFFTGLTDDYHTPEDDFEKINVDGVAEIVDYSEELLDIVLEDNERPRLVKTPNARAAKRGGVAYLGIIPDYSNDVEGLRIDSVTPESPAAMGGLLPGDVIRRFADIPIADLRGLTDGLRANKPGDIVKVTVQRAKETVTCSVRLGRPPENLP